MKKNQLVLGGIFVALPFLVVSFLSVEVAPADSSKNDQELHKPGNTCMHEQPNAPERNGDCSVLSESRGG